MNNGSDRLLRRASVLLLVAITLIIASATLIPRERTVRLPPPEEGSPAPTSTPTPVVGGEEPRTDTRSDVELGDVTATATPSVHDIGDTDCGPECYSERLDPH